MADEPRVTTGLRLTMLLLAIRQACIIVTRAIERYLDTRDSPGDEMD